jgi:Domain of unknown function (DUF6265)
MKTEFRMGFLTLCLCSALALATAAETPATTPVSKVSDLAFMAGRWLGAVDNNRIEQTCTGGDPVFMMCMFRLMDDKGTQMLEFYTFRNTATGVEERALMFSPDLKADSSDGFTMELASITPTQLVFENHNGTYPKRSTLTRTGNDEMTSHIELVDGQGKTSFIDAHWTRAK